MIELRTTVCTIKIVQETNNPTTNTSIHKKKIFSKGRLSNNSKKIKNTSSEIIKN